MAKKKPVVMSGEERKKMLVDVGAQLASKYGAKNVTRRMVAKAAKVSEALVANYCGNTADAQKLYKARAKKLGLVLPDKAKEESIGAKLRAHGPRDARDVRPRSAKEKVAIAKKSAVTSAAAKAPASAAKKTAKKAIKPTSKKPTGKAIKKVAPTTRALRVPKNKAIPGAPENKSSKYAPLPPPPGADAAPVALPPLPPVDTNSIGTRLPPLPPIN